MVLLEVVYPTDWLLCLLLCFFMRLDLVNLAEKFSLLALSGLLKDDSTEIALG